MKVLCGSGGTGGEPEAGRAKAAKYFLLNIFYYNRI